MTDGIRDKKEVAVNIEAKVVCESGIDVVPPVKPVWDRTVPYGYKDDEATEFALWGDCVVGLFRSSVVLLNPLNGEIVGGSDILPESGSVIPLELKDLVVGDAGEGYAWARLGKTQVADETDGEPWQVDDWALARGYPRADWTVVRFDLMSGNIQSYISPPGCGFQSTNEIGRRGRFMMTDDGHFFDWRAGKWLDAIPAGEAAADAPWRSSEGYIFEKLPTGWHRISREGTSDRFVKLPCGALCVHTGTDNLIGGLNCRRLMAWRCSDLAAKGLEGPRA